MDDLYTFMAAATDVLDLPVDDESLAADVEPVADGADEEAAAAAAQQLEKKHEARCCDQGFQCIERWLL